MDWVRILAYVTGTVDQELLVRNEYHCELLSTHSRKPAALYAIAQILPACDRLARARRVAVRRACELSFQTIGDIGRHSLALESGGAVCVHDRASEEEPPWPLAI
jgi:hypothetical protein